MMVLLDWPVFSEISDFLGTVSEQTYSGSDMWDTDPDQMVNTSIYENDDGYEYKYKVKVNTGNDRMIQITERSRLL